MQPARDLTVQNQRPALDHGARDLHGAGGCTGWEVGVFGLDLDPHQHTRPTVKRAVPGNPTIPPV